jgi:hypothetical protein
MGEETDLVPVNLFGASHAVDVIIAATDIAGPLADLIRRRGLASAISGREYVRVEGWTLLGSMLGVFPIVEWSRPVEGGWEARVEARTRAGELVGAAEAECLRTERNWQSRDDFALRSMAQTRATSKALRLPLGFVMSLAGFEATPAEEMIDEEAPSGPPCPHCQTPVQHNPNAQGKQPVWSCPNRGCGGGEGTRKDGSRWPWASWDPNFFAEEQPVKQPVGEPAVVPEQSKAAWDDLTASLEVLGVTGDLARSELEAYATNPAFAAGSIKDMRAAVNRAAVLTQALHLGPETILADWWAEWQTEEPSKRAILTWPSVKGAEVQSFAKAVQQHLRGLLGKGES